MKTSTPALLSLALGGLCIGTTEFAAMGLLPLIASSLGATIPQAGHIISAYALGVVVGAPLLTVLAAKWDRKVLLIALMAFYSAGNIISAFAPSLGWLILGRFLAGLPHGAFFGIGAVMGAFVAGPERRGRAVAVMMAGLTVANVIGVPLVTWAGQALGWRLSYVFVGALGLSTVAAIAKWMPRLPIHSEASVSGELAALRNGPLWMVFASGAVGFGGMFAVYSYVSPLLTATAGLPLAAVPLVLSLFGAGMTVGALAGGRSADRSVIGTALAGFALTALVLLGLALAAERAWAAVFGIFVLGVVTQILAISLQSRLMDLSPRAPSLGASLCHSGLNIGNAAGAWLGGLVLAAGYGNLAPAWVGLGLTLAGGLLFLASLIPRRIGLLLRRGR
jgi:MFS transporter, DHA1 family, inner membrane transport protein